MRAAAVRGAAPSDGSPGDTTPIGHDEDGDGIPDVDDPCPALAGDMADGDGVGDACDPNPTMMGDRIALFSPLTPGTSPFGNSTDTTGWMQEADALHVASMTGAVQIDRAFTRATRIEVGFEIVAFIGNTQHQIASGVVGGGATYDFVEINQNGALHDVAIVELSPTNGYTNAGEVDHDGMHAGAGKLQYDAQMAAPRSFSLVGGWTGELYMTSGPTPSYTGGTGVSFVVNGVDARLRYVFLVESPLARAAVLARVRAVADQRQPFGRRLQLAAKRLGRPAAGHHRARGHVRVAAPIRRAAHERDALLEHAGVSDRHVMAEIDPPRLLLTAEDLAGLHELVVLVTRPIDHPPVLAESEEQVLPGIR